MDTSASNSPDSTLAILVAGRLLSDEFVNKLARLLSFFSAIYLYSSFETNACSLGMRNIKAFPLALYLAVRPTRCT